MKLRPLLVWVNRLLWTLLVCAVIGAGAVVALVRHYVGYVADYREEVAAELSRRTGLAVQIDGLQGHWRDLAPQFEIAGVRFYNPAEPDTPVVALDQLTLRLGLFHSLNEGTLVLHRVSGRGLALELEEIALGRWRVRGAPAGQGGDLDPLIDMLLAIHRAHLEQNRIGLRFFDGGSTWLEGDLTLERSRRFRRLGLDVQVAGGAPIRLALESRGDPRRQRFSAEAYAEFSDIDLSPLLPGAQAWGIDLRHGRLDGRAWLSLRRGQLTVRGQLAAPELDLAALTGRALPPLTELSGEFLLQQRPGERQLWLPRLRARWGDHPVDLQQLYLSQRGDRPDRFHVALAQLELAPLRELMMDTAILPERILRPLAELAPVGELQRLQLTLPISPDRSELFELRAELHQVALQPWHEAPGVAGLSGFLQLGAAEGSALLEGDSLQLVLPHVFDKPLPFDRARAAVRWRLAEGRMQLQSGTIELAGEAGRGSASIGLDMPLQAGAAQPPAMTLLVAATDSDARYLEHFLPRFLQPELRSWLLQGVRAGRVTEGAFLYRGSLRSGDYAGRTVQLHLAVEQGELAYQPGWPVLHHASGSLWLDDQHARLSLDSGRLLDRIELSGVEAALAPAADRGSWLTLQGMARGEDDDLLKLLRETPLRQQLGDWLDPWHWQGPASAGFNLGVPIGSARPPLVDIDAQLEGGTLTLGGFDLVASDLRGPLAYHSDSGLVSEGISGLLHGQPLRIRAGYNEGARGREGASGRSRGQPESEQWVAAQTQVTAAELRRRYPLPLLDRLSGSSRLDARLSLAPQRHRLSLSSDLQGLAVDLPAPYTKAAQAELPLQIDIGLGAEGRLKAVLGDWGELRLQRGGAERPASGALLLGRTGQPPQRPGELAVAGHLPPLDLGAWRGLLQGAGDGAASSLPQGLQPVLHQLYCPEVRAGALRLRDVQLSGRRSSQGWQLYASSDRLSGALLRPAEPQLPWQLHLERLHLAAAGGEAPAEWLADVQPESLPAADVRIDALWRGDENWGTVAFQLRPQPQGLRLDQLNGTLRELRLRGQEGRPASLVWRRGPGGDSTEFNGRLEVGDLGRAMTRWQYERIITTRSGWLDASVHWPGRPDQFAFGLLDGSATLALRDGRFLKTGAPTEGALKVVGIFNFANLLRRLRLDFSDLFSDGISFDRVDGRFELDQGVVQLPAPLAITGPATRFRIEGELDFNTDLIDMELTATLPLAGNLPWVAAIAGGLPAAAGVYVASKLFGDQVDRVASAVYDVSGPWREPDVRFRRFFDDRLEVPAAMTGQEESSP